MINKYRLWNIVAFGGGGGDGGGGGGERDTSLDNPNAYGEAIGPGLPNSPDQVAKAETDNQAKAEAVGQPPATTNFSLGPVPDGAMPTGVFSTANNPGLTLNEASLASANSANIAAPAALAAMGATPTPQMAADLAAMGGVPAPTGTPMPPTSPDFAPQYSSVDFTGDKSLPSFARDQSMIDPLTAPLNSMVSNNTPSIMDYKTAKEALDQAAMQNAGMQSNSGFETLMAFANGEKPPTMVADQTPPAPAPAPAPAPEKQDIMSKILDMVVTPAKAEDMPPQAPITPVSYPGGIVPMPTARPPDLTVNETPPEPAPAPTPFPPSNPAYSAALAALAALAETPPAPVKTTTPFEDTLKKITEDAPKNLTNTAVGFIPGVGIVNTVSGLFGGPTVGGAIFPGSTPAATAPADKTYSQPSLTDAQYKDLMNQPGFGSEDPGLIADFNNYNANTYGNQSGPTTTAGELAVGQRTPQTMVPHVNADGTVTMVPNLGSQVTNFIENLFNPNLTKVGSPEYNKLTQPHTVSVDTTGTGLQGGGPDIPPAVLPPKTAVTPTVTPTVTPQPIVSTPTLASNFRTKYLGAPNNLLRYGYGPERAFFTKAAKGGAVGPLNMMMRKP